MPQTLTCGRVVSTPLQQAYAGLSDGTDVAKTKSFECRTCVIWERRRVHLSFSVLEPGTTVCGLSMFEYRKISKISPRAYIFQRPFLRGLFLEGLIFGGAYLRGKSTFQNRLG